MVRILELIASLRLSVLVLVVLAACSSSGPGELATTLQTAVAGAEETDEVNPADVITRAQIDRLGVAMIRVRETRVPDLNLLIALRKTNEQVTYVLRGDRRLVLVGGLIQSTYGFGDNLEPIGVGSNDPVAYPRPIAEWPKNFQRTYTVAFRGTGETIEVYCSNNPGRAGTLDIVEMVVRVQEVSTTCSGPDTEFTNTHYVEPSTGFIWRSAQWTGPVQGVLQYENLEPLE